MDSSRHFIIQYSRVSARLPGVSASLPGVFASLPGVFARLPGVSARQLCSDLRIVAGYRVLFHTAITSSPGLNS